MSAKQEVSPHLNSQSGMGKAIKIGDVSADDLDRQAQELADRAKAAREQAKRDRESQLEREREADMATLATSKARLAELENVSKMSGKLTLNEAKQLTREQGLLSEGIREIQAKYGLVEAQKVQEFYEAEQKPSGLAVWITTLKIAALLLVCWGIVLFSGDWIVGKYPQAAVYNEVSFQKILFGFSVFVTGFVSVILALNVFFPGFGRYFNPFNHSELDFFDDFKTLNEWQRNIIALGLFGFLLLCFVMLAGGKLD